MMSGHAHAMQLLFQLVLAALFGAVLGYERETHGRSAGLRTNLLVSVGSALMTIISLELFPAYSASTSSALRMDPARIAAQIVVGIGFIGAGVIIKERGGIRGLTTAATLWLVAGVGMACGAGMFLIATATTAIALVALTLLARFERVIPRDNYRSIEVVCFEKEAEALSLLKEFLKNRQMKVLRLNFSHDCSDARTVYDITVSSKEGDEALIGMSRELAGLDFVTRVKVS